MTFLLELTAVVIGGILGASARFLLSSVINTLLPKNYPWGIWVVNIVGCFIMGIVASLFLHKHVSSVFFRALIMVGLLGSFTTFSSYTLDTLMLAQAGEVGKAFFYLVSTVVLSILATALAYGITNKLI